MQSMVACGACGLIQTVEPLPRGTIAHCARCELALERSKPESRKRTLAFALAAFLLYFPANLSPILSGAYLGVSEKAKMFDGIQALFDKGNYLVAGLVFTTSIVAPGVEIVCFLTLALMLRRTGWQRSKTYIYRTIQLVAPWSMLPVTLLALVVAFLELGQVATVHPGPGLFAFAAMVAMSAAAKTSFDPQLIWEDGVGNGRPGKRAQ